MKLPHTTQYQHHFDGHGRPLKDSDKCKGHWVIHADPDGGTVVLCDECGDGYKLRPVVMDIEGCRFSEGPRRARTPAELEYEELEAMSKSRPRHIRGTRRRK